MLAAASQRSIGVMLRQMTDMPAGTIGFEAVGEVEDDDWEDTVEPVLRRRDRRGAQGAPALRAGPGVARRRGRCHEGRHGVPRAARRRRSSVSPWSATRTGCVRRCARCPSCCRARRRASAVRELADAKAWLAEPSGPDGMNPDEPAAEADGAASPQRPARDDEPEWPPGSRRLAVLLAMAMFVLVVDTSLMNVSIAKRRRGPRHDRQRRAGRDRARGAGVGRVHPDREQGRRPHRAQARVRPRPARLRDRRPGDGVSPRA